MQPVAYNERKNMNTMIIQMLSWEARLEKESNHPSHMADNIYIPANRTHPFSLIRDFFIHRSSRKTEECGQDCPSLIPAASGIKDRW
jgi:hypothetical protein